MANVARFLLPQPPRERRHISRLFVDREKEMRQAKAQVAAVRKDDLGLPMALVGQARVGKSHLLRELVRSVANNFDATVEVHVSTGLSDSRDVLRETLQQVHATLHNAALGAALGPAAGPGVLAPLEGILADYSEAVAGSASEIELSRVETVTRKLQESLGLSASLPGLLPYLGGLEVKLGVGLGRSQGESEGVERRVRVARFEDRQLTELIGMAHVLLRDHEPRWRTLLVLDDFDLLKRDEEGGFDPEALLQALTILASIPGLYVLTTVRQDTYRRHDKTFHRIADVVPFADDVPLIEIYRRHVKLYHGGEDPFAAGFVKDAARLSTGRVGIFLQHMREAFMVAGGDLTSLELSDWIQRQWTAAREMEPELAGVVERAAEAKGGFLQAEELTRLRPSSLMQYVLEDYSSASSARVDPVLLGVLREGA